MLEISLRSKLAAGWNDCTLLFALTAHTPTLCLGQRKLSEG
jgi:hypothetical protein